MFWQWFMYGALAVNAFFVARKAILFVQNGSDQVDDPDSKRTKYNTWCWQDGSGHAVVAAAVIASPFITLHKVAKFIMFPRGLKSEYAKELERRKAQEEIDKADRELLKRMPELERQVRSWAPGGYILDSEQLQADVAQIERDTAKALGADERHAALHAAISDTGSWSTAADSFDEYAALIAANAGVAWVHPPTRAKAKKAKS